MPGQGKDERARAIDAEVAGPLASFCLFTFNQEEFVREALNSAFAQEYSPLEIIIIDDGSADGTADVVRDVVSRYTGPHRIKLEIKDENKGLAHSVNRAIYDLAEGDWLVFAAGDDISVPDRVSRVVAAGAKDMSLTLIESAVTRIDAYGKDLGDVEAGELTLERSVARSALGAAAAYRRAPVVAFPRIGDLVVREDVVLTTRALLMGDAARLSERLVQWRRHDNNLSGRAKAGFLERTLHAHGKFVRAHDLALGQQMADVNHAMNNRRIETEDGIALLLALADIMKKNGRGASFFEAVSGKDGLLAGFTRRPGDFLHGLAKLASLYTREQVFRLKNRFAR